MDHHQSAAATRRGTAGKKGAVRVYVRKIDYTSHMPQSYQFQQEKDTPANSSSDDDDDGDRLLSEEGTTKIQKESFYNISWDFPFVVVELDKLSSPNPTVQDVALAAVAKAQTEWSGWKFQFMKQFEAEEKRLKDEEDRLAQEEEERLRRERAMTPGKMTPIKTGSETKKITKSSKLRQHLMSLNMSTVDCYDTNEEGTLPVTILEKPPTTMIAPPLAAAGVQLGATTTLSRRLSQPHSDMITPRTAAGGGTHLLGSTASYRGQSPMELSRSPQGSPGLASNRSGGGSFALSAADATTMVVAPPQPIHLFIEELDEARLEKIELVTLPEKLEPTQSLQETQEASLALSFPRTLLVVDKPSRLVDADAVERSLRELREYTIQRGSLKDKRAKKALKERQQQVNKQREDNVKKVSQERDMRQVRSVLQSHKTQEEWQLRRTASRSNLTAASVASSTK